MKRITTLSINQLCVKGNIEGCISNILDNISIPLKKTENTAIVGPSGSGKSMLARSIMGILPDNTFISSGNISLNGEVIYGAGLEYAPMIRGSKISMVFQNSSESLNPFMKISTQICESIFSNKRLQKKELIELAENLLDKVHINNPRECLQKYPFELSGGTCQRIAIAIAIANDPEIIIADEPTTALDSVTQFKLLSLFKDIQEKTPISIVFITHNLSLIQDLCNNVIVLSNGSVVERDSIDNIINNPQHALTKELLNSVLTL